MLKINHTILVSLFFILCACHREDGLEIEREDDALLNMGTFGLTDITTRVTITGAFEKGESVKVTAHYSRDSSAIYTLQSDGATDFVWSRTSAVPLYFANVKNSTFKVETWGGLAPVTLSVPFADQSTENAYLSSDYCVGPGTLVAPDPSLPLGVHNHQLDAVLDHQFTDVRVAITNQSDAIIDILYVDLLNKGGTQTRAYNAGSDNHWGIVHPDSIPAVGEDFVVVGYQFKSKTTDTLLVEARLPATAFDGLATLKGSRLNIALTFNNGKLEFDVVNVEEWVETEMEGEIKDIVPIIYDDGTDVFKIYMPEGLKIFADLVNGKNTTPVRGWESTTYPNKIPAANGKLMRDVSLLKYMDTGWTPIGDTVGVKVGYRGHFDGSNRIIKHLRINNKSNYQGLFGSISGGANLKNINIVGCDVTAGNVVGGIVGIMREGTSLDSCKMTSNESLLTQVTGTVCRVGLMVGYMCPSARVSDCAVVGGGVAKGLAGTVYKHSVGGLVGVMAGKSGAMAVVERCTTDVTVVMGLQYVGGLVGYGGDYCRIVDCDVKTSSITGSSTNVGGLAGNVQTGSEISGCKATTIYIENNGSLNTGGLVGSANAQSIRNCQAVFEELTAPYYVGGLVGQMSGSEISDCKVEIKSTLRGKIHSVGGLVGYLRDGVAVKGCEVVTAGVIKGQNAAGTAYVHNIGGLIGAMESHGTIDNCKVDINAIYGSTNVGGLIGLEEKIAGASVIKDCTVKLADLTASSGSAGGLMGVVQADSRISDCTVAVSGLVKATAGNNCGGFIGSVSSGTDDTRVAVTDCQVKAQVDGSGYTGGFVGCTGGVCDFTNCTSEGKVRGKGAYTGGFIGVANNNVAGTAKFKDCKHENGEVLGLNSSFVYQPYVGGFVGSMAVGVDMVGCTADCDVTGSANVGGFAGYGSFIKALSVRLKDCGYMGTNVLAKSSYAGGFIGLVDAKTEAYDIFITKCSAENAVVTAKNGNIYGPCVGGFIGQMSLVGLGNTVIEDVTPSNKTIYGAYQVGGLLGNVSMDGSASLSVKDCNTINTIEINSLSAAHSTWYGGMIGSLYSKSTGDIKFQDCHATGNLNAHGGGNYIGGFAGKMETIAGTFTMDNCYATGRVYSTSGYHGGFAGSLNLADATVSNCYATGAVEGVVYGQNYTAGFAASITCNAGELTISKCYSSGLLSAGGWHYSAGMNGGFAGAMVANKNATIKMADCYRDGGLTTMGATTGGFVGLLQAGDGAVVDIENCETRSGALVNVRAENKRYGQGVGGFVGVVSNNGGATVRLKKCSTVTEISSSLLSGVGGFVGTLNPGTGNVTISDCKVTSSNVDGGYAVGGFVGQIASSSSLSTVDILRCETSTSVLGSVCVGGFCAEIYNGGCHYEYADVRLSNRSLGISGKVNIMQCVANGDVSNNIIKSTHAGGFIGMCNTLASAGEINVYACAANGNVTNDKAIEYSPIGGFAGYVGFDVNLLCCYAKGNVETNANRTSYDIAGGFAAYVGGQVHACYSTGDVRLTASPLPATSYYGGFAGGLTYNSEVSHCATVSNVYQADGSLITDQAFCGRSFGTWDGDAAPYSAALPNPYGITYENPTNYQTIADDGDIYGVVSASAESFTIDGVGYTPSSAWINSAGAPKLWWE